MTRHREHPHAEPAILLSGTPLTHLRPDNPIEALMLCPPGVEPDLARNQLAPLRDILADAILTQLDDRELWIFEALHYRRLSLRQLARELSISKTHIARIRDHIHQKLQQELLKDDTVRGYVHGRYNLG